MGYAYGAPLLYGGRVIPVALTTGLALMGTGVALVALAGPASLPLRPFSRAALQADQHGLRELARKLLQRQGYTVLVAANADEALRVVEHHAFIDLLLTDVVMPGASGPELTRNLLERRPGLKVIYMSGYTEETIVHHGVLKPAIAFLQKPFTSAALARKVRQALDR